MAPFTFVARRDDSISKIWSKAWIARFVTRRTNFGSPLLLPSRQPSHISSLVLLPSIGLLLADPSHNLILLFSFSDHTTSIYAGSGQQSGLEGHRARTVFRQPSSLCLLDTGHLVIIESNQPSLKYIREFDQVQTISYKDELNQKQLIYAQSIAVAANGGFLVISRDGSCFSMPPKGSQVRKMEYGQFVGIPVISASSRLLPLKNGRNIVCGSSGLFSLLAQGQFEPVLPAKALGFVPVDAVELNPTLFLISDSQTTYVADLTNLDKGIVVTKPISDVLKAKEENGVLGSIVGPFCFDEASGKIWSIANSGRDTLVVSFELSDVVEGMSDVQSLSNFPSPSDSQISLEMVDSIERRYTLTPLTTTWPTEQSIVNRGFPASSLAVTPTGHIIEARDEVLRWFDASDQVFKPLAGLENEAGLLDAPRLEAQFNDIGSICFAPISSPCEGGLPKPTPNATTSNTTLSCPSSQSSYSNLRHIPSKDEPEYVDRVHGVEYAYAFRPDLKRPKSFLIYLLGTTHRLLIADSSNHRIREMDTSGEVRTYAGSHQGVKDGPKSTATFSHPKLMCIGKYGEVFLSSGIDLSIRRISVNGVVTTLDCGFQTAISHACPELSQSYSSIASNSQSGHLILAYQSIVFAATPQESYKKFSSEENESIWSDSSALNFPPQHCFKLSIWAGKGGQSGYKDSSPFDSRFEGPLSLAVLPEYFSLDMDTGLFPSYLARHHLLVLDSAPSAVRFIQPLVVSTIAARQEDRIWPREGSGQASHLPGLESIVAYSSHSALANDLHGNLILLSDCSKGINLPNFPICTGFRSLLPSSSRSPCSRALMPWGTSISSAINQSLSNQPTNSDFELFMFGALWPLHRGILELRSPGLLNSGVVQRIEAQEWLVMADIDYIIRTIYLDEKWRELPSSDKTTFYMLGKRYCAALAIDCSQLTQSVEEQIQTFFRIVSFPFPFNWPSEEGTGFLATPKKQPTSEPPELPSTLRILETIDSLRSQSDDAAMKLLLIFAPYMVADYLGAGGSLTPQGFSKVMPNCLDWVPLIWDLIHLNRFDIPPMALIDYHEPWYTQWRGLLTSFPKERQEEAFSQLHLGPIQNSHTSIVPNLQIRGVQRIWNVHRWILAAKSAYFNALFSSLFTDAKSPIWVVPTGHDDPGFLSDASMGAFLDYLYTDDPTLIIELDGKDMLQVFQALPFYCIQDTAHHLCILPVIIEE